MGSINVRVGAWLLERGNSKEKLASQLGITTTTLDKKLRAETEWSWGQAQKLATILGCSLDDLANVVAL